MNALVQDADVAWASEWMPKIECMLARLPQGRAVMVRQRMARLAARLHGLLWRLYGKSGQFELFFERLMTLAVNGAQARQEDLWQLDLQREVRPGWLHEGLVGYCAYVDKFAGTLDGVASRIPYLQELGVNYLHLLPFLKVGTPPNDGGFAVASFSEVEPALGSMASLSALCTQLRQADISLCSDLVLNHVSSEHPWALAASRGDSKYKAYFHWCADREEVASWEQHLGQVFPSTAPGNFTHVDEAKAWVWSTFYPYQWDLNWSNPDVFADMADAILNLANHGVEAFRLDSTGYLWKRRGTSCVNQPEAHTILQALRAICDIVAPGVLLKAEAIMPTRELPPYFGLGEEVRSECHLAYHSSLMAATWLALAESDDKAVRQVLRNTPNLPEGRAWLTYVRCHDDIGWNVLRPDLDEGVADVHAKLLSATRHYAGLDGQGARGASFQASDDTAVHGTNGMTLALLGAPLNGADGAALHGALAKMALAQSLSFFVGGLPMIYMGDELGQDNLSQAEINARSGPDGRELHRPQFDEHSFALRHATDSIAGRCFGFLSSLAHLKRSLLKNGEAPGIEVRDTKVPGLLVLCNGALFGLFNFSSATVSVDLVTAMGLAGMGGFQPRLTRILGTGCESANAVPVENVSAPFILPPHGHAWLVSSAKTMTSPNEVSL